LKSTAIKTELPEYSSTQTTVPSELENPFDQDAGAALRKFADTASTIGFPVTSKNDTEDEKRPELPRNNSTLTKMLIQTVKDGSITDTIEAVKVVHVDSQDQDGRTALSWAAELGRPNIAELLISRGASLSIRQYSTKRRAQNRPDPKQSNGRVPLHWAAACDRPVIANLLLRNGANPNARSTVGRSALQEATMHNNISIVKMLLEHGVDVNARSYNHVWKSLPCHIHLLSRFVFCA
jgi:ankyrin repeat protein